MISPTGLMSGAEAVLLRIVHRAVADGWEVTGISPPGPLVDALGAAGASVVKIPNLRLPNGARAIAGLRLIGRTLKAVPAIRSIARRSDVLLVNGIFALPALRIARPGKPLAWLVHDVVHRRSWKMITRLSLSPITLAIAVSEAVAEPLRSLGLTVTVIRNGTPWPVSPNGGSQPAIQVVGCSAMLTSWKGQSVLLDAVAMLPASVKVELMGGQFPKDAPYVATLHDRAAQPDLAGRVEFLGHVDDILARMRTWSVAVSASINPEAGPLAPLEAMSIGLPVVGTNHGGTTEVIGDAGLLVRPGDAKAMAVALARLLDNPTLWRQCHEAGPKAVAGGLTVERQLDSMMAILAELAD